MWEQYCSVETVCAYTVHNLLLASATVIHSVTDSLVRVLICHRPVTLESSQKGACALKMPHSITSWLALPASDSMLTV